MMKYLLINSHKVSIQVNRVVDEEWIVNIVCNEVLEINLEVVHSSNCVSS